MPCVQGNRYTCKDKTLSKIFCSSFQEREFFKGTNYFLFIVDLNPCGKANRQPHKFFVVKWQKNLPSVSVLLNIIKIHVYSSWSKQLYFQNLALITISSYQGGVSCARCPTCSALREVYASEMDCLVCRAYQRHMSRRYWGHSTNFHPTGTPCCPQVPQGA